MALSFATDIRPLFRDEDITCMDGSGVHLDDHAWMCVPANAQSVYDQVSTGAMPPDEPWSPIMFHFSRSGWTPVTRTLSPSA